MLFSLAAQRTISSSRSPRPAAARGKAPDAASPARPADRRVAIIGAGFISNTHAEALRQLKHVQIDAVVDPVTSAARAFAGRWGIPRAFSTVDELISAGEFDCAHVLVPPPFHSGVGVRLLEAGKTVLVEKPMAPDIAGCDALIEASEMTLAIRLIISAGRGRLIASTSTIAMAGANVMASARRPIRFISLPVA